MTEKRIYLHTAIGALVLSVPIYCLPLIHLDYFDTVVMKNGATLYDVVYFNSVKAINFLLLTAVTYLCFWIDDICPDTILIKRLKYFALFLTGVSFVRMVFHFFTYSKIGWLEIGLYFVVAVIGLVKYIRTAKGIKNGNFDTRPN